jgi:hypothetical protein
VSLWMSRRRRRKSSASVNPASGPGHPLAPFPFLRATATPQSKSTSTRELHETRSSAQAMQTTTASSSPSAASPVSAVSLTSSVPTGSLQDVRGVPMPPHHPAAGAGSRQRPSTAPNLISLTPAGGLTAAYPRQTFEGYRRQLHQSIGSELVPESDREDDRPSRSGQSSPDGSLEAREREDSVGLLSPPSSQPSPRASVLDSRNGSATSLARISGAFRSRGILAQVQAVAGAHDTIHTFQYLARRSSPRAQSYPWH